MATPWKTIPENVPTDTEVVWVRLNYFSGIAILAEWDASNQQFTSVTNSIVYPAWIVGRWKSQ